jgi:hypothetical protein
MQVLRTSRGTAAPTPNRSSIVRTTYKGALILASGALTLPMLTASPALADGGRVLRADLIGSTPSPVGPTIAGIQPGSKPWVTGAGSRVRVRRDGRISVRLHGLVIPIAPFNGTNPIASVVATLVCGNAVADSTDHFALDTAGNGSTSDVLNVPRHCDHPTVLIQPDALPRTAYIAVTVAKDHDDD